MAVVRLNPLRVLTLLTVIASGPLAFIGSASAQPTKPNAPVAKPKALADTLTGQAKVDYEAARVLATDGDYAGAAIKFQAAYDASKDGRLLWNLAACQKQLRHYARAIDFLKAFAADTSGLVSAKEKSDANELVKTLEPFTVAVTIQVNEPDASIEVDGTRVGTTHLSGPLVLDIGPHKLRVQKAGFRDGATDVAVGGSPQQTITIKLEKEVHEGKLSLVVPPNASVVIDGKPATPAKGNEPLELVLSSGGHTLRVTAPGMRAYEREVVIKDNETRTMEIMLERAAEREKPILRVAVGCIDAEPRGLDDGLAVYFDHSPTPAVAVGGKTGYDEKRRRAALEYVGFPLEVGSHTVLVKLPGCTPEETTVDQAFDGALLRGALRSSSPLLMRGPVANPDWGRLALSVWHPSTPGDGIRGAHARYADNSGADGYGYHVTATGVELELGIALRWFLFAVDVGYASGSAAADQTALRFSGAPLAQPRADILAFTPDAQWFRTGIKLGVRFPFHSVALSLGNAFGYDSIGVSPLPTYSTWDGDNFHIGVYSSLEVMPLCSFGFFGGAQADLLVPGGGSLSANLGLIFQPSSRCHRERETTYGLASK